MNKRVFLLLLHLLMVSVLTAQTSSENYVHIRKYLSSDSSQWYLTLDCDEVSLSGSTSASSYYFDLKDYQGNVRMAVRSDTSSPFVTDYYPYKKEKSLCKKMGKGLKHFSIIQTKKIFKRFTNIYRTL